MINDYNPDLCAFEQGFGGELANAYRKLGLLGHPGIDTACGYGTPIHSPVTGIVTSTYTPEHPASDGYVGVYILVETALEIFEYCIGHMSEVDVKPGDQVKVGDLLGREGNSGYVFAGNEQITVAMQKAGDRRGSHRHNQKRIVYLSEFTDGTQHFLEGANGRLTTPDKKYFYRWVLPANGYNSCVDFSLPLFNADMTFGNQNYHVGLLQKALGVEQTGYFGAKTQAALQDFQQKHGVSPSTGFCGPKTRAVLNTLYGQLCDPQGPVLSPTEATQQALPAVAIHIQQAVQLPMLQRAYSFQGIVEYLKQILAQLVP